MYYEKQLPWKPRSFHFRFTAKTWKAPPQLQKEPTLDMAVLCKICTALNLRQLFTGPGGNDEVELGSHEEIEDRGADCELCQLILSAIDYGPWKYRGKLGQEDGFVLVPVPTAALRCKSTYGELAPRACRLHIFTDDFEDAGDVMLDSRDAGLLGRPALGYGRLTERQQIDNDVVKSWISDCRLRHKKCDVTYRSVPTVQQFPEQSLLIDVHKQCLVHAPQNAQYAALSYKWGEAQQYLTLQKEFEALQNPGALNYRPLPPTVRDAITLTSNIGLDFLWVDALCIIQDSPSHKAKQISQMHLVYGYATVTIVATSSAHADEGLAGVSDKPRNFSQSSASIDGLRLMPRKCFLGRIMNASEYNTRAWTYQESSLSRRVLSITSRGVTMQCCTSSFSEEIVLEDFACDMPDCQNHSLEIVSEQRNVWREFIAKQISPISTRCTNTCNMQARQSYLSGSLPTYPKPTHTTPSKDWSQLSWQACTDCISFLKRNEAEWLMYQEAVRSYTHRQMRFESDRIPAFSGLAGILADQFDTRFLFGLPEKYLDLALLWAPRNRLISPCRRDGLRGIPSWSWASHEISAGYSGMNWLTSEVDWYRVHDGGELEAVRSLKTFGAHALLPEDFRKAITLNDLEAHDLLPLDPSALYAWCQISRSFYLKNQQLHDSDFRPVKSALGYVRFSDMPPVYEQEYTSVEVLLLSRGGHQPIANVWAEDWDLQGHVINLLVVERTEENVVRRLAMADINDVKVWKSAEKEWRLVKFV